MSCPICFSEIENPVVLTGCRHSGCLNCVLRWTGIEVFQRGRYPCCFMCRETFNYILTLYGDEVQRVNSFNSITIPAGISPLEYARNGFFHVKPLATAFEYDIGNAVECFDCAFLHFLHDSIDINSLKIAHITKHPNCPTARANGMSLDLI